VAIKDNKLLKRSKPAAQKIAKIGKRSISVLASIGGYFKNSWIELQQVRWPNRKSTWSMTLAVILFTTLFIVLIILLDYAFKQLFELILK
jgi:preprotein translocase SecE subunit